MFEEGYDIVVSGGGIAGVSAALAASGGGKRVALVEKGAFCGGLATGGMVYIYLPLDDGMGHQVSFGLAERLFRASIQYGPGCIPVGWDAPNPGRDQRHPRFRTPFSPAAFILALDEMLEQAGVALWLDTVVTGVHCEGSRLAAVDLFTKGGGGRLTASVFVDATGDAQLVRQCGGAFIEGKNQLCFWGIEVDEYTEATGSAFSPHLRGVIQGLLEAEPTRRALSPRAATEFLLDSRRRMRSRYPGADRDGRYPVAVPTMAQFRQAARIVSQGDLPDCAFNRAIPGAIGMAADWCDIGVVQEIPYSALLPATVTGVLVAGRCIGADGYSWELTRSIPAAAVTGEAAGTAAALAVERGVPPHELPVADVQAALRTRGCHLTQAEAGIQPDSSKNPRRGVH